MRFQIASDLHLEFFQHKWPGLRLIEPEPTADALILAGDIGQGAQALQLFADWPVPVVYVAGNHDFYGFDKAKLTAKLREMSRGSQVRFLEREAIELGGARILGATFWTDYALFPEHKGPAIALAHRSLADHRWIQKDFGVFGARDALEEHAGTRHWIARELAKPFAGPTVVVTHHAPHARSVHSRFASDLLSAAFASDCSELMGPAALWVHGHVHDTFDYGVNGTRVVANPRGYSADFKTAKTPADLKVWENPHFQPSLVIEV